MTRRHLLISLLSAVGLLGLVARSHPSAPPPLVYNASASVPLGYYRITAEQGLTRGQMVLVRTPPSVSALAAQRGYLPKSVPMLKTVAALAGDTVCASKSVITIDGRIVAHRLSVDHLGRPLPTWEGCRHLASDEVFLLNATAPYSFDGRYFGVVKRDLILGRASPL